jgi:hypothetical protein
VAVAAQAAVIHPWPALAWWLIDRILPGLLVSSVLGGFALVRLRVARQQADERHEDMKAHVTAMVTGVPPARPDPRPEETVTPTTPVPPAAPVPQADGAPHWGFTRHHKMPVHARTIDHLPSGSAYQRFNKRVAVLLTRAMGSMTAFWIFTILCICVLPSVLYAMGIHHVLGLPSFVLGFGFELLMTWFLSTLLELVLMPAIMVGQNIASAAADSRAAKQFEDTEIIADRLDTATQGGITEVLNAITALRADLAGKS